MASKELLGIPDGPPGLLLLGQQQTEDRSRPDIGLVAESSILSRLKNFLPEMAQANARLEDEMKGKPREAFDIEANAGEDDAPHIEMDLALGVAELKTPEAVAAAERAMKGQTTGTSSQHQTDRHGQESSDDEEGGGSSKEELSSDEMALEDAAQEGGKESDSKGRRSKKRSRIQEM